MGTHKTGTTTIQRTLGASRPILLRNGISYPDYASIGRKAHYAHLGIANALAGDHPNMTQSDAATFFERVRRDAERHDATLISAEPMYRQTIGDRAPQNVDDPETYWAMRNAYIERLHTLIGPAEIAIVVRRQADFAESMYQEHVKVTRYSRPFETFLSDFWFNFRYLDQVRAWERVFGKVTVIPFDDIKGAQICTRFLDKLNLHPGELTQVSNMNVGLPHDAVILKRELNAQSHAREQLNAFASLMSTPSFDPDPPGTPRSFFDSAEARAAFQDAFARENDELSARTDQVGS